MGYICPYCDEGLPKDETCPCQSLPTPRMINHHLVTCDDR
jgi:hypothetical protein